MEKKEFGQKSFIFWGLWLYPKILNHELVVATHIVRNILSKLTLNC